MDIFNNRDEEQKTEKKPKSGAEIATIVAVILSVFVCITLITNGIIFGVVGAALVHFFQGVFGYAAYPLFIGALVFFIAKLFKKKIKLSKKYIAAFTLMFVTGIFSVHLFTTNELIGTAELSYGPYLGACYNEFTGGGVLAGVFVYPLAKGITVVGTTIILVLLFLLGVFIACDFLFIKKRGGKHRIPVEEYRDYPVSGGPAPRGTSYADYTNTRAYAPPAQVRPEPRDASLSVRPVRKGLYVGSVSGDGKDDFGLKTKREKKNDANGDNLDLLYDNRQPSGPASGNKKKAAEILFQREARVEPSEEEQPYDYDAYDAPQEKPAGGQSYLENFEENPIRDIKNPKDLREYILKPPTFDEMYPEYGSEYPSASADSNRPRKIVHDKNPGYIQISLDDMPGAINGGIPRRKTPEFGGRTAKRAEQRPAYPEPPREEPAPRPPIINAEEAAKNAVEETAPPPVYREVITPSAYTEPTDKVVNFKDYKERHTAEQTAKEERAEQKRTETETPFTVPREEPPAPVPPKEAHTERSVPEQIAIPPGHLMQPPPRPAPQEEPQEEPQDISAHERAVMEANAVKKPPKPKYRYQAPPIDLIKRRIMDLDSVNDNFNEKARILEDVLEEFKVPAKVVAIVKGPTVTRYELDMPRGIPVKRVTNFAKDLAMRLESENGVRIEAPIPGKNRLGIEVPNTQKLMVGLREVLESPEFNNNRSSICFALGKDVAGKNIVCDLDKMPHLLVAGSTGAGKSVCLNTLIVSLLYKSSPDDVRIILIDPKQVEFNTYNEMPHLMLREVISSPEKAISALNWAIIEMERRYTLFRGINANNLSSYNERFDPNKDERLPKIVIIVDELADLMATSKREVEEKIQRLVQKSRAAGIHLVLATQRPSVDIITGVIKNNLPSRIAFKVVSYNDSRTILDSGGAENLLGSGDMLYKPASAPEPLRLQGAFLSMEEVEDVVRFIKEHNKCDFDESVEQTINRVKDSAEESNSDSNEKDRADDPFFVDALRTVIESKQASISMLQRKFSIGYSRAGKLIDEMERLGYVSAFDGSKPRQVYITQQQFAELYGEWDG